MKLREYKGIPEAAKCFVYSLCTTLNLKLSEADLQDGEEESVFNAGCLLASALFRLAFAKTPHCYLLVTTVPTI